MKSLLKMTHTSVVDGNRKVRLVYNFIKILGGEICFVLIVEKK